MNEIKKVKEICASRIPKEEKIRLLEDLILDFYNEMEAQDQNMHPEIKHNQAEAYRLAKNAIRELKTSIG